MEDETFNAFLIGFMFFMLRRMIARSRTRRLKRLRAFVIRYRRKINRRLYARPLF